MLEFVSRRKQYQASTIWNTLFILTIVFSLVQSPTLITVLRTTIFVLITSGKRLLSRESLFVDFIRVCYQHQESRKIGLFLLINLSFMFIELIYGFLSNSLGLITDSFHMLFDCFGLLIGLCASYIAKLPSDKCYTYGYGKVETLSGFFNGLLLIYTAFNVLKESIHRIYEPQHIDTTGALLPVSCIGFLVNMIGLVFFHEAQYDHHHVHSEGGPDDSNQRSENM